MEYGIQMSVQVLSLVTGFVLVLWGLRIFKVWVATLGLLLGGITGGIIATFAIGSDQAAIIGVVAGALAGALLAWPLQKMLVLLATAAIAAILATTSVVAIAGTDYVAPAAIGGFVAGAIAAAVLFDTVVIAAMALSGAQFIFHAVFVPAESWIGSPRDVAMRMLGIYVDNIMAFGVTTLVFVAFAWWYQKRLSRRRIAESGYPERLITARRVPFRLALLLVATIATASALALAGFNTAGSFELLGFHTLSWPIVAWATAAFLRPRPFTIAAAADGLPARTGWHTRRFASIVAFGLIVPPMLSAALFAVYGFDPDTLVPFYRSFIFSDPGTIVAKAALSLGLLPAFAMFAVPAAARRVSPVLAGPVPPPAEVEPEAEPDPDPDPDSESELEPEADADNDGAEVSPLTATA